MAAISNQKYEKIAAAKLISSLQLAKALVAQWIELSPPKGEVTRSIRVGGAKMMVFGISKSLSMCGIET